MWQSILPWLLAVALVLVVIVGTVEAWSRVKKFKNKNGDANKP
jgi:hypothetical protein